MCYGLRCGVGLGRFRLSDSNERIGCVSQQLMRPCIVSCSQAHDIFIFASWLIQIDSNAMRASRKRHTLFMMCCMCARVLGPYIMALSTSGSTLGNKNNSLCAFCNSQSTSHPKMVAHMFFCFFPILGISLYFWRRIPSCQHWPILDSIHF